MVMQGVGVSIARGTGRQTLGAAIVFFSYYVVALPIGVPLMFATYLGLAGIILHLPRVMLLALFQLSEAIN